MSTPSTASVTLPPHQSQYGYPPHHHQAYGHYANNHDARLDSSKRLAPSYPTYATVNNPRRESTNSAKHLPASNAMTASHSGSGSSQQPKREKNPDWHEFYKNGPPKEIIVIDDDSPPPAQRKQDQYPTARKNVTKIESREHLNKKRKTGQTQERLPRRQQASFSNTNTPQYLYDGSNTISTDRTTSLQTTAPTSLGSHGSGDSRGTYLEEGVVGQKRKRVTRQQTADDKKRKEIEVVGDAYSSYLPPPKPPIKAKDVYVQQVKDVGTRKFQILDTGLILHSFSQVSRRSTMTMVISLWLIIRT